MTAAPVTCTQKSDCGHVCGKPHHGDIHWPGQRWQPVCWDHLQKGRGIAEHMGFALAYRLTPAGWEYREALKTVEALGGDGKKLP